jgi:hypothetical protein
MFNKLALVLRAIKLCSSLNQCDQIHQQFGSFDIEQSKAGLLTIEARLKHDSQV